MRARAVPWLAVGLLSAAALAYEVLLTRILALLHWHHLVGMIVSLALLGYGASGSFLTVLGETARRRFETLFLGSALVFAIGSVLAVQLAARVPLDPLELPWNPRQWAYLAALFGLLAVPFFGVASCIGLALWRHGDIAHRIYAVDLLGAGAGSIAVLGLLFLLPPPQALPFVSALGLLGAAVAGWELRPDRRSPGAAVVLLLGLGGAGLLLNLLWSPPEPAPYKDLSRSLAALGARVEAASVSPLGVVKVVRNEQVPARHAPGLSMTSPHLPPPQRALFVDNDAVGALTAHGGELFPAYLGDLTSALPYALLERPRVLVPRLGDVAMVQQALGLEAASVLLLEPDSARLRLLRDGYREFLGGLLEDPRVRVRPQDPRAYLATHAERFDLIQLAFIGGGDSLGLQSQQEAYLYTREAFEQYLKHLSDDGLLALTRWLYLPPRDSLRLLATARDALRAAGADRSGEHLALIRDWRSYVLLVSASPLSPRAIDAIEAFARKRSFDLAWLPDLDPAKLNRSNRLPQAYFHQGAAALLGARAAAYTADYAFDIRPVSDDRPYAYHFTRRSELPRLLREPGGSGYGQLDWGFLTGVATLILALGLGLLLVLAPLWKLSRGSVGPRADRMRTLAYFIALGIGFLFIEMAFIQRFHLFLGHPVYATAVVLAGFLVFAGLGSLRSRAWGGSLIRPVFGILLLGLSYLWLLPPLFEQFMALPLPLKVLISLALIAPLAYFMGMPFPLGLARLSVRAPGLVPWAWGVNGCASVVSAAAAPLLAMEVGFSGLVLSAAVLYALLPWIRPFGGAVAVSPR